MSEGLVPWDTADYLRNKDDVCLYLEAATEEDGGDGSLIQVALSNILRAQSIGNLSGQIDAECDELRNSLSAPDSLCLAAFMRFASALGMRLHLSVPPELEERLAGEEKLLTKQVGPVR